MLLSRWVQNWTSCLLTSWIVPSICACAQMLALWLAHSPLLPRVTDVHLSHEYNNEQFWHSYLHDYTG